MKKILIIITIILLTLVPVIAQEAQIIEEQPETTPGGIATYNLVIVNNRDSETIYTVKADQLNVYPFSNIIKRIKAEPSLITLAPGESEEVLVTVEIIDEVQPGQKYQTSVTVKSPNDENIKTKVPLVVDIRQPDQLVLITTNFPNQIIPGNEQEFSVTYEATTNTLLLNTSIEVISDFFYRTFEGPIHFKSPLMKTIPFDVKSTTQPGTYELRIKATQKGKEIGNYVKTFEVIKNPDIVENAETKQGILIKETKITKRNNGNLIVQDQVRIPISKIQEYFLVINTEPTSKTDTVYTWSFELQPGEEKTIQVRTDYTPLAAGIIVIVLAVLLTIYFLRPKIVITKAITHVSTEKDGVSEVKIKLTVKNRGQNSQNVRVVDTLPQLMKTTGHYGTLKPKLIKKTPAGHKIGWEFTEFHKREVRILTYTVHSRMHIVGAVRLPAAHVLVKRGKRTVNYRSNTLIFSVKKPELHKKKR